MVLNQKAFLVKMELFYNMYFIHLLQNMQINNAGYMSAYLLKTIIPKSERSSFMSSSVSWTSSLCLVLRCAAKVSFLGSVTEFALPIW